MTESYLSATSLPRILTRSFQSFSSFNGGSTPEVMGCYDRAIAKGYSHLIYHGTEPIEAKNEKLLKDIINALLDKNTNGSCKIVDVLSKYHIGCLTHSVGSLPLAVPTSRRIRLRISPKLANCWTYSR